MRYILLTVIFLSAQFVIASDDTYKVKVEEEIVLSIKKFRSNRTLPHAFYDQAVSSIPKLYPEHVFFAKRRYGRLGKMQYSIVCYKETEKTSKVLVIGTAVLEKDAWSFDTHVDETTFGDKLLIVLEAIEKLPSNKALQPTAESGG